MALRHETIIAEAVRLLDEGGLDGVTLRKLADRLHVQAPTLYWHITSKAELVNDMAEAILRDEFANLAPLPPSEPWQGWLTAVARRLRKAMTGHRDGARLIAGAHMSATMASLSEAAITALLASGVSLRDARLTVLAVERFTIGFALEEQAPPPDAAMLKGFDLDAFTRDHPHLAAGITEYFGAGNTVDDLFEDSLRLILR